MNATRFAPRNCLERSASKSTIGDGARRSMRMNATREATLSASSPRIAGEPQPQPFPSTSANTSAVRETVIADDAGDVDAPVDRLVARLLGREQRDDHRADGDGEVDEEDRAPGDLLGQPAADDRADRERDRRDAGPGADRLPALMRRERVGDDREGRGHHERRADPLDRARGDERAVAGREADRGRGEREHDDAEQEHPAAPEDVAEPSAGDEQHGERQRVRVDGPLERGQRRVEAPSGSTAGRRSPPCCRA